ncbi:MAG: putative lipid II flippase FtsW [Verrucomicrobia bacterium]|nr:putative lipid II flippase FtsW [Verrucomicrobiota bacterium]
MKVAVPLLVFCVGALLSLGLVMLYSSGIRPGLDNDGARFLVTQLAWFGIGTVACVSACCLDYRWLKKGAWIILGISVILLVLVLLPGVGKTIKGASRWFDLGFGNFQPSEAAKLALIIALARYGERHQRNMTTFKQGFLFPCIVVSVVLALIFVEPDRGTTVLLAAVCGAVLLVAGAKWRYLITLASVAACGLAFSLWNDPIRIRRILVWLYPDDNKQDAGFQGWGATLAFGSGGWTGLGLGNSRQKMGLLPEHHTDFILPIIGEELGAVATLAVVLLFIIFIICGTYIAWKSRDTFGLLLGSGIVFLIGLQALINIGVVTSTFPNKGLPLPFVSYGGSNLLLMLSCVGILLSIARRAGETGDGSSGDFDSSDLLPS